MSYANENLIIARLIYEEPKKLPDKIPFLIIGGGGAATPIPSQKFCPRMYLHEILQMKKLLM